MRASIVAGLLAAFTLPANAAPLAVPTERPARVASSHAPTGAVDVPVGGSCFARLSRVAAVERVRSPRGKYRACRIKGAVRLTSIRTAEGPVEVTGKPVLACTLALSLAGWTREVAAPSAKRHVRRRLTALRTGPGYQCRRRNRRRTGKLSEHGLGNAVDISGFRFDARGKRASMKVRRRLPRRFKRFQKTVRAEACRYFTTTLGPGSDRHHSDHLHFDHGRMYRNGKRRANPPRVCR